MSHKTENCCFCVWSRRIPAWTPLVSRVGAFVFTLNKCNDRLRFWLLKLELELKVMWPGRGSWWSQVRWGGGSYLFSPFYSMHICILFISLFSDWNLQWICLNSCMMLQTEPLKPTFSMHPPTVVWPLLLFLFFVCLFWTFPSCSSPRPSATLHTLFCVSFPGGARRPSILLLWSLFMISVTPSLLVLLPANLSERCSGPGCDPERIQRRPRWTWTHPGGEQFPSLDHKDQRWLIKDAVHQFDWILENVFCLILLWVFFTLRLYAWLLQRRVFLPGKSQFLFADVKLSKRGGKYENDQRFQGTAGNILGFVLSSVRHNVAYSEGHNCMNFFAVLSVAGPLRVPAFLLHTLEAFWRPIGFSTRLMVRMCVGQNRRCRPARVSLEDRPSELSLCSLVSK